MLAVGLAVVLVISLAVAFDIGDKRQRALQSAKQSLRGIDFALAQQLEQSLQSVSLVLTDAAELAGAHAGKTSLRSALVHRQLRQFISGLPQVRGLAIVDAKGNIVNDSFAHPPLPINVADREHFTYPRDHAGAEIHVSAPHKSRADNEWTMVLSRRLHGPDGAFLGTVFARVHPTYFEDLYKAALSFPSEAVSVLRRDSVMMFRFPRVEHRIGTPITENPIFRDRLLQKSEQGFYEFDSAVDGSDRIGSYYALARFPLLINVSVDKAVVLQGWRRDAIREALGSLAVSLVLLILVLRLSKSFQMQETAALRLIENEHSLIAARQAAETANASKTRFLAAASHDLRQPIQAMSLYLDVLNLTALDPRQREIARNLSASMNVLGELLHSLLDISKLDAGAIRLQLTPTDVRDVLRSIEKEFAPIAQANGLRFDLFCQRPIALVTDATLLATLLRNIVSNALRNTARGGVLVAARRHADRLAIQVWDTGIGIPAEHLANIYDEFFQIDNPQRDRTKGLGLGLAIVKRIAALLGYEVTCRSRSGRGTMFEVSMPCDRAFACVEAISTEPATENAAWLAQLRGMRVALIEDDRLVAEALAGLLAKLGMAVTTYSGSGDALLDEAAFEADFYVSDFRLPGTMNGIELLEEIQRRAGRSINAVIITGDTSVERSDSSIAGRWEVLHKPVAAAALLEAISAVRRRGERKECSPADAAVAETQCNSRS
jgi:signal transduction histidine kinase/ActR/RegA family two-component response regulator